ncbi:unnamed protein product [Mytilus edulis]|uniref:Uncharacterized protein n=1 Tax=Mytilus edulis TaxID=6550 RepID=A0A8S3PM27_MYTED|nr:unnamed protein product [Mytilus edulis]
MSYLNLLRRYGDVDSAEDGLSLGEAIRQLSSLITCHECLRGEVKVECFFISQEKTWNWQPKLDKGQTEIHALTPDIAHDEDLCHLKQKKLHAPVWIQSLWIIHICPDKSRAAELCLDEEIDVNQHIKLECKKNVQYLYLYVHGIELSREYDIWLDCQVCMTT